MNENIHNILRCTDSRTIKVHKCNLNKNKKHVTLILLQSVLATTEVTEAYACATATHAFVLQLPTLHSANTTCVTYFTLMSP